MFFKEAIIVIVARCSGMRSASSERPLDRAQSEPGCRRSEYD
jgi:hypothetical protein